MALELPKKEKGEVCKFSIDSLTMSNYDAAKKFAVVNGGLSAPTLSNRKRLFPSVSDNIIVSLSAEEWSQYRIKHKLVKSDQRKIAEPKKPEPELASQPDNVEKLKLCPLSTLDLLASQKRERSQLKGFIYVSL